MTEIDKLIEEASNEHKDETDYIASQEYICGCSNENDKLFCWEASTACSIQARESFKAGANFILHLNRWRKVEEELPEYKDIVYQILIRIDSKPLSVTVWTINNKFSFDVIKNMGGVEWKPI